MVRVRKPLALVEHRFAEPALEVSGDRDGAHMMKPTREPRLIERLQQPPSPFDVGREELAFVRVDVVEGGDVEAMRGPTERRSRRIRKP